MTRHSWSAPGAAALGKSEGACRMIQHRALRALSRLLGGKQIE